MSITAAMVVFFMIWFITMFVTLQITARTQGEDGEIVPGTHAGAPANFKLKRIMLIVTAITFVLWAIVVTIIITGAITVRDFDWFGRMDNP